MTKKHTLTLVILKQLPLFVIAASDGNVAAIESEEIRVISKGLELTNQHFLAARAEVADFLKAL